MKHLLVLPAFAAAMLVAGAAGAASNTTPSYAAPVIADANAMKAADEAPHANLRQQLHDQLTKAGYTNIKIAPSSFYIRAEDKKGEPVAMVIGPDTFTEVTEVKTPAANAQAAPKPSDAAKK